MTKKGWKTAQAKCLICVHYWQAVYEVETPEDKLECPRCGSQESEIADGPD